jgi:hypothetical protein
VIDTKISYEVQFVFSDINDVFRELIWWSKYKIQLAILGLVLLVISFPTNSLLYLGLSGLVLLLSPVYSTFALKGTVQRTLESLAFSLPQDVVLDSSGVSTTTNLSHGKMAWTQFCKWNETSTAFVLYPTPYTFLIVPKRCVPHDEIDALRALLDANVENGARLDRKSGKKRALEIAAYFVAMVLVTFVVSLFCAKQ